MKKTFIELCKEVAAEDPAALEKALANFGTEMFDYEQRVSIEAAKRYAMQAVEADRDLLKNALYSCFASGKVTKEKLESIWYNLDKSILP